MSISISDEHMAAIRVHGEEAYPCECCGFMLGSIDGAEKRVEALLKAGNEAVETKERRFLITPQVYMRAEKEARSMALDIAGFYHSHPDHPAQPSQYDLDHAWPVLSYVIISVQKGKGSELTSWVLNPDRSAFDAEELVGRT